MKRWLFVVMVMALSLLTVSPVLAHEDMGCAHDATTIASLRDFNRAASAFSNSRSFRTGW